MSDTTTAATGPGAGYRVRRALTTAELTVLRERIDTAPTVQDLLITVVVGVFGALLADLGETVTDRSPGDHINPRQYVILQNQWQAITAAATNRANAFGDAATLALELVNLMPAVYDDPTVPDVDLTSRDHRPDQYRLEFSRDAGDEIAACEAHLAALAERYGSGSATYRMALDSWHRQLAGLFSTRLGAATTVHRDGPLSFTVVTEPGLVYGVIFRGQQRRCTSGDCHAVADDPPPAPADQPVWRPAHTGAAVLDHEHVPTYPFGAPEPGTWTSRS
jgi:hypothetical protein